MNALIEKLGLSEKDFEIIPVKNAQGDTNLKDPLYMIGGLGVFTK